MGRSGIGAALVWVRRWSEDQDRLDDFAGLGSVESFVYVGKCKRFGQLFQRELSLLPESDELGNEHLGHGITFDNGAEVPSFE